MTGAGRASMRRRCVVTPELPGTPGVVGLASDRSGNAAEPDGDGKLILPPSVGRSQVFT